jgi:hypothetical protein
MFEPSNRFVVVRNPYSRPAVILADWKYWTEHELELIDWCVENHARRQGMTVEMPEDVLMLFVLRWS